MQGLRARKKHRTRLAIRAAALEMFDAQGYEATTVEDIAARAEVSVTTFFRYFPSKDEVVFAPGQDLLPRLQRELSARATPKNDLEAVRRALLLVLEGQDLTRLAQEVRVVSKAPVLRGRAEVLREEWQAGISEALAKRHGLPAPDNACRLTAEVALVAYRRAAESWVAEGAEDELADRVTEMFELLTTLARRST